MKLPERRELSSPADEHTLSELCIELVKLQEHVKAKGLKVCERVSR
jgi:hypothetical protein